ncbi:MAG: Male sterility domain-containing protein, partial [Pyrinomonas methylaliphatogenes]|nr:Male sterility domain-containing protein [Pyrinomonas methylaliphatogenes]
MKTIFVTGFPGFIAGRLIELLAQDDNARFLLLIEPRFGARARAEIARLAQKTAGDRERFHLLEGDIT